MKCRALVDTGVGSSYASAGLLDYINAKPTKTDVRNIEMLLGTTTRKLDIFHIEIKSTSEDFSLEADVTKIEKHELLTLSNPRYNQILEKYQHLNGVVFNDKDSKEQLPIHLILGVGECAKIKTSARQKVGVPGDPVAELTKFGWILVSPGQGVDLSQMFLTQTSSVEYEELCRMDVLGLADMPVGDQEAVYEEFKEQLSRSPDGWYQSGLPWKGDLFPNGTNKANSQRRLQTLVSKLRNSGNLEEYDNVIQEQLKDGVVEPVPDDPEGREFYIPHKGVFRETAESTKLRVVYDASARPTVRIRKSHRDALRFYWLKDIHSNEIQTFQFTRALFGLTSSPFLLGGVLQQHLETWRPKNPAVVDEISKSLYVDDLVSGATTTEKATTLKNKATEIFQDAIFELHKWQSNAEELDNASSLTQEEETYAKQQLGVPAKKNGKLLGLEQRR